MLKLALLTTTALFLASPAYATGDHTPAPTPTPPVTNNTYNKTTTNQGGNATAGAAAGAAARSSSTSGSTSGATVNNTNNVSAGNGNGGGWNGGPGTFPANSAYAPSFALSSICQEAISGGVSVFWAGASGGKVYTLDFCKMTMQAEYYRKQGREDMAKAAECKFSEARALYKETGTPCREDEPKATAQATPVAPQPQRVLNAGGLQCVDAAGRPVALGQPGAVRCN